MIARASILALCAASLVACGGGAPEPVTPEPASASAEAAEPSPSAAASPSPAVDVDLGPLLAPKDAPASAPPEREAPAPAPTPAKATSAAPEPPRPGEEGARAVLAQFVAEDADHVALTRALKPSTSDYRALFDAKTAAKVEAAQSKDWSKAVIKPKPGQTEIRLAHATRAELAKGTGAAKEFPSEYTKFSKHLLPSAVLYRFKFVEPGKETGTAYDGLAFVNGRWVIAPKPWRALERRRDDAASDRPAPKKRPAKNPTKKKKKKR